MSCSELLANLQLESKGFQDRCRCTLEEIQAASVVGFPVPSFGNHALSFADESNREKSHDDRELLAAQCANLEERRHAVVIAQESIGC